MSHAQLLWIRQSSTSAPEVQQSTLNAPYLCGRPVASKESCEATMIDLCLTTWPKFLQSKWIKGTYYTDKLPKFLSRVDILWLKVSRPSKWHTWEVTWGKRNIIFRCLSKIFLIGSTEPWVRFLFLIQLFLFWPLKFRTLWLVKVLADNLFKWREVLLDVP